MHTLRPCALQGPVTAELVTGYPSFGPRAVLVLPLAHSGGEVAQAVQADG